MQTEVKRDRKITVNLFAGEDRGDYSMKNDASKSWFAVFNNPAEHGYKGTPQEVCERLKNEWIGESNTRTGAWAYCISPTGMHHIHMVLEDTKTMRFSAIKKSYCIGMHFEATKGNKNEAEDYINKRGKYEPKDDEKAETVEYIVYHGEIKGRQGKRSDLDIYYERLQSGETPRDILADTPKAYCHIGVLKNMYYDIRSENTPIVRDMKVYWHIGKSGSGKSYQRVFLANEIGEENIYYLTSFNSGAFDNYNGQPVLWIEDYRGEFKLQELLRILDKYKAEIPARYTNVKALWNEVHITSVLTPRECYPKATLQDNDRIEQLLRRITSIVFHFKNKYGEYYQQHFPSDMVLAKMQEEIYKVKAFTEEWVPLLGDYNAGDYNAEERSKCYL